MYMEELTRQNFSQRLCDFLKKENLSIRLVAKAIGCSESTVYRLLDRHTQASDEMINQVGILFCLGFAKY